MLYYLKGGHLSIGNVSKLMGLWNRTNTWIPKLLKNSQQEATLLCLEC